MSEVSILNVSYNLAEFSRLQFAEEHPREVGVAAMRQYVEAVPDTLDARAFGIMLENLEPQL